MRNWNRDEELLFKKALKGKNLLYTYKRCRVLIIPDVPELGGLPEHEDVTGRRRYEDRGWCFTELAMSSAHGRVANDGAAT